MGVSNQKAVKNLLIAKNIARTATAGANISAGLVAGEVVVTDISGKILDTTSVNLVDVVQVVQGQGANLPLIVSAPIKKANVYSYSGKEFNDETPQIDYVGYNGTSGSIDVLNSNAYDLKVYQMFNVNYAEKSHAVIGYHKSDTTATQAEIAAGVQLVATDTLKGYKNEQPFKFEVLSSAADVAMTGPSLIFTKGSKVVTSTATTALSVTLAEGDWIKVATGTSATTGIAYKVKSFTAAGTNPVMIVLESAYQGATATVASGTHVYTTAAIAASANFGFKISGITQAVTSSNVLNGGLEDYQPIRFKTIASGFGSTTVTSPSQSFVAGNGLPVQVAVLERQLLGNEGFLHAGAMPFVSPRATANLSADGYSFVHLEFNDRPVNGMLGLMEQPKELDIALESDTATNASFLGNVVDPSTGVYSVLESWLVTNGSFSTAVIQ
jgi:hypothetical protein